MSHELDQDVLRRLAQSDPRGSLGLDDDPELAFAGIRTLRAMAEFCETYQVTRLRHAGYSWARIASWTGVSAEALHKKHAQHGDSAADPASGAKLDSRDSPRPGRYRNKRLRAVWDARSALLVIPLTRILGRSSGFPSPEVLGAKIRRRCLREGCVVCRPTT